MFCHSLICFLSLPELLSVNSFLLTSCVLNLVFAAAINFLVACDCSSCGFTTFGMVSHTCFHSVQVMLVSWASPHQEKQESLVKRVYKPRPTMLYSVTQSHCSIWSHDVFLQFAGLDNAEGEPRLLYCYCRSCKALQLYFSERMCTVRKGFSKGICVIN